MQMESDSDNFESALSNLIVEWHDERGVGFEDIISALELQLTAVRQQIEDEIAAR